MYSRNKAIAIESIAVMLVLILLSFMIFLVIRSGSSAYEGIINEKQNTESARVAYSYINMKIKQNDSASLIRVVQTKYGNALQIDTQDKTFSTFIFFSEGELYECLTNQNLPDVEAANKITKLDGFDLSSDGKYIKVMCVSENSGDRKTIEGIVGLRT